MFCYGPQNGSQIVLFEIFVYPCFLGLGRSRSSYAFGFVHNVHTCGPADEGVRYLSGMREYARGCQDAEQSGQRRKGGRRHVTLLIITIRKGRAGPGGAGRSGGGDN